MEKMSTVDLECRSNGICFSATIRCIFLLQHIFSPMNKTAQNKKHYFVNFKRK